MPGVVSNEKETRKNFKEERTLELVTFEIRKKEGTADFKDLLPK